jgi:methanol--5-hydroxybenzimidazolylcobamide Co-methyltransferase
MFGDFPGIVFALGVLAAVVRAMSAVRSLAAFEQGALGPSKDCAYESR